MTANRGKRRTDVLTAKHTKRTTEVLPDLEPIVDAFWDAPTAHAVLVEGDSYGADESVLRQGCDALKRVRDQLEDAQLQLARFRKSRNGKQVIS